MIARLIARTLGAAAIACLAFAHRLRAGAAAAVGRRRVALGRRQILELKGALAAFDPLIDGVIEHHKNIFLQINPNLAQGSGRGRGQMLRTEFAPRRAGAARPRSRAAMRSAFTEQELKDMLAFYKTPLGKKLIDEEPKAVEDSHQARRGVGRQVCRRGRSPRCAPR